MKTSNKLLLGVFLAVIFIVVGIHVTLLAKYKSGDFVYIGKSEAERLKHYNVPAFQYVSVSGLGNLVIIPSDTAELTVENRERNLVFFHQSGDTLIITGDSLIAEQENRDRKAYQEVRLKIKDIKGFFANNTELVLHGYKDSVTAGSLSLNLNKSGMRLHQDGDEEHIITGYWGTVTVNAIESEIGLYGGGYINMLQLALIKSKLNESGVSMGKVTVQADNESELLLRGTNINKIVSKQP